MLRKTIKISEEVHERLMALKRELSFRNNRDFTISETIEKLLDLYDLHFMEEDEVDVTGESEE